MGILQSVEFVPGVKCFESGMHDALFQHSVFGAIVFLIVSNTGVYKFVKDALFSVTGFKADGNTLQFIHAVVFAVIMYFGSMYLFAPLMTEGMAGGMTEEKGDDSLDSTYDSKPCGSGMRIAAEYHGHPLRYILDLMEGWSGFCVNNHEMTVVDQRKGEKVGITIATLDEEAVDENGAHMYCDPDKTLEDCTPATDEVDEIINESKLLTSCWGWFGVDCDLKKNAVCKSAMDYCGDGLACYVPDTPGAAVGTCQSCGDAWWC